MMQPQLAFDFAQAPPAPTIQKISGFELVRSRRRTISIEVHSEGRVVVRAPKRLARRSIDEFVLEKEQWIARKQAELAPLTARIPKREYVSGENYLYLGDTLTLDIVRHTGRPSCFVDDENLKVLTHNTSSDTVRAIIANWYKACAEQTIPRRVERYSPTVGREAKSIKFRENKRRWGSCNATTESIIFNTLLVMAPMSIIDYVVVHELCHLIEPNHSTKFWQEVGRVMPDYDAIKEDLKDLEPEMVL